MLANCVCADCDDVMSVDAGRLRVTEEGFLLSVLYLAYIDKCLNHLSNSKTQTSACKSRYKQHVRVVRNISLDEHIHLSVVTTIRK